MIKKTKYFKSSIVRKEEIRWWCLFSLSAFLLFCGTTLTPLSARQKEPGSYITAKKEAGSFTLSASGKSAPLYIHTGADPGVVRALKDFKADVEKVTGAAPELVIDKKVPKGKEIVLVSCP